MPDSLELPGMLCPVVPLMRRKRSSSLGRSVVLELVALAFQHSTRRRRFSRRSPRLVPGFSAVIRALNDLSEPSAALRGINPVRINQRPLQVVHLPAGKVRTAHVPLLASAIGRQDECALFRADQYSYSTHAFAPPPREILCHLSLISSC